MNFPSTHTWILVDKWKDGEKVGKTICQHDGDRLRTHPDGFNKPLEFTDNGDQFGFNFPITGEVNSTQQQDKVLRDYFDKDPFREPYAGGGYCYGAAMRNFMKGIRPDPTVDEINAEPMRKLLRTP